MKNKLLAILAGVLICSFTCFVFSFGGTVGAKAENVDPATLLTGIDGVNVTATANTQSRHQANEPETNKLTGVKVRSVNGEEVTFSYKYAVKLANLTETSDLFNVQTDTWAGEDGYHRISFLTLAITDAMDASKTMSFWFRILNGSYSEDGSVLSNVDFTATDVANVIWWPNGSFTNWSGAADFEHIPYFALGRWDPAYKNTAYPFRIRYIGGQFSIGYVDGENVWHSVLTTSNLPYSLSDVIESGYANFSVTFTPNETAHSEDIGVTVGALGGVNLQGETVSSESITKSYAVTFDGGDAIIAVEGDKLTAPIAPAAPVAEGCTYTFDGWYNGETKWNFDTDTVSSNLNLVSRFNKEILDGYLDPATLIAGIDGVNATATANTQSRHQANEPETNKLTGVKVRSVNGEEVTFSYKYAVKLSDLTETSDLFNVQTDTWTDDAYHRVNFLSLTITDAMDSSKTMTFWFRVLGGGSYSDDGSVASNVDFTATSAACVVWYADGPYNLTTGVYNDFTFVPNVALGRWDPAYKNTAYPFRIRYIGGQFSIGYVDGENVWQNILTTSNLPYTLSEVIESGYANFSISFTPNETAHSEDIGVTVGAIGGVNLQGEAISESGVKKSYAVTFDGGDAIIAVEGDKLTAPAAPAAPVAEGCVYTFDGWYNGETKWNFDTDTVSSNLNLVSVFNKGIAEGYIDPATLLTGIDGVNVTATANTQSRHQANEPETNKLTGVKVRSVNGEEVTFSYKYPVKLADLTETSDLFNVQTDTWTDNAYHRVNFLSLTITDAMDSSKTMTFWFRVLGGEGYSNDGSVASNVDFTATGVACVIWYADGPYNLTTGVYNDFTFIPNIALGRWDPAYKNTAYPFRIRYIGGQFSIGYVDGENVWHSLVTTENQPYSFEEVIESGYANFSISFTPNETAHSEDIGVTVGAIGGVNLQGEVISESTIVRPNVQFTATFMADDVVVAERTFTFGDTSVEEPAVPEKEHFTGAWESYKLTASDMVINAIYTPVIYTLTVNYKYADGTEAAESYGENMQGLAIYEVDAPAILGYRPTAVIGGETVLAEHIEGVITGDTVIEVTYTYTEYTFTVNFVDGNGATVKASEYYTYKYGESFDYTVGTIEGYTTETTVISCDKMTGDITENVVFIKEETEEPDSSAPDSSSEKPDTSDNESEGESDSSAAAGCLGSLYADMAAFTAVIMIAGIVTVSKKRKED